MDHAFPSEQPSLPYNLTHISSDTEVDYSAHQSQADFYPGNLQRNGTEVSSITPGSYSYPFHQVGPWDGSEYLSIQRSIPSTPNDRTQFHPQPPFPSNDLSHTHDQVLESFFEGDLIDNEPRRLASIQAHRAAGLGRANFRIVQEGIVDHLEAQGGSGSDPLGSSSTTIADTSSSLSDDGFYSQYGVQDDYPRATSSRRQVVGVAQSHAVTPRQDAAKQEAFRRRQRKLQEKRERDRSRKEADRAGDDRAYSRVCTLLEAELNPKNTRSQRILESVESIDQDFERMCELLDISMTPRKTLAHRILEGVEAMAEQQKLDRDLRRQLEDSEAEVAFLKVTCATQHSIKDDAGPSLPITPHTALGGPNTVATWVHGPCPNCEGD